MTDKILSKIRKLMNTANGTAEGGEHERDTAMKMALNLLTKHNLSMADLTQPTELRKAETDQYHSTPWMRIVGYAIAELFFCGFFSSAVAGKNKRTYTFVGLEGNVTTAREMTSWVIVSIQREATAQAKAAGHGETWANSFRKGAANKVASRCRTLRAEAERANAGQASSGTSLVLASLYDTEKNANALYITDKLKVKLVTKQTVTRNNMLDGVLAGEAYGQGLSLNKQIGEGKANVAGRLA
jgi:hypothetical protein